VPSLCSSIFLHNAGSATSISSYLKELTSPEQLTENIRHLEKFGMELEVKEISQIVITIFLMVSFDQYCGLNL